MPFVGQPGPAPPWFPPFLARRWDVGSAAIRRTLRRAKTARKISPGGRLGLPFEDIELHTDDGVRLSGWFVPGASDAPDAGGLSVVLHHHYGGQKAHLLPWISLFHLRGIPCIAFDARGHGSSDPAPRGRGSFVRRSADFRAALDEAQRRDCTGVLAVGQSQGAAAMVIGAAGHPLLSGYILDCGPAPEMGSAAWGLAGNLLGRAERKQRLARLLLALRIIPGTEPIRYVLRLWFSLFRLRRNRLLWLHGDRDEVIRRSWSGLWFGALRPRGGRWTAMTVPGGEHVRSLQMGGDAVEGAVDDLLAELRSNSLRSGA